VKPPKTIRIGPHEYRVRLVPDSILEGAGADGTCQPRRLVIALDGMQPPTQLADTLCHEIGHALLSTVKVEEELEESICLSLGPALFALVRDNPALVDWIRSL
jgi:hypothetical protein